MKFNLLPWFVFISFMLITILFSCNKTGTTPNPAVNDTIVNHAPDNFIISLSSLSWDTAKVTWTKAIDKDNDSVSYKVYLNDTLKAANLSTLAYTFTNLKELTKYHVKIVATDTKQKESVSYLSFTTLKYWLKFLKKIEYGYQSGYEFHKVGKMIATLHWRKCSAPKADHLMPIKPTGLRPDFKKSNYFSKNTSYVFEV